MKAVSAQEASCCVYEKPEKVVVAHAWQHSIHVWLLGSAVNERQCDQMDKLVFQYLAIYNNENLSKIIQIDPKWVRNFAKNEINL